MIGLVGAALAASCTTITEELPVRPSDVPTPPPILLPPAPGPAPTAAPNPRPTPNPRPPGPPPNTGKVAKLGIKVEWVVCNGVKLPNTEFATSAKVGCQIYFDSTAKDAANKPTQADGVPNWDFQPMSIVKKVNDIDPWAPIVTGGAPGLLLVSASVDGVRSVTLRITLHK
jgi:hypothetical protein